MKPNPILVSAGLVAPKKTDHPAARKHRYLNYGLLTLGTLLYEAGYNVRMIHGQFSPPGSIADEIAAASISGDDPLLLSLPSYFSVRWAREFVRLIKKIQPATKIIAGGRWVVGNDGKWLREKIPDIDLVVFGTAEQRIESLIHPELWPTIPGTDLSVFPGLPDSWGRYIDLAYQVMDGYLSYHPSIEVSRGCGRHCAFCEERDIPLAKIRSPKVLSTQWKMQWTYTAMLN